MTVKMNREEIWKDLSGDREELVLCLSNGDISIRLFHALLDTLQKSKLHETGMKLSSSVSEVGVVHFSLRFADTDEVCASIDVDPATGKLTNQLACH